MISDRERPVILLHSFPGRRLCCFFFQCIFINSSKQTYISFFQSFVITNHLAWLWFISHQLCLEWTIFKAVIQPLYTDFSIKNVLPFLSVVKGLPCQRSKAKATLLAGYKMIDRRWLVFSNFFEICTQCKIIIKLSTLYQKILHHQDYKRV